MSAIMETLGLNELVRMNKRQVGGESSIDNRLIVVLILWIDSVLHCLNCLFFLFLCSSIQLLYQVLNFGMIVSSALMIWKGLMVATGSESPIVVVLR